MGSQEALRLVDECLGLIRLKRDFEVINNLIDRYKKALAEFYDKWADDFAGRAVDVKNEFQWFGLRDSALRALEEQMVSFGNQWLPEAFGMGLTEEMTDELQLALDREIAVNDVWIRNSLVPNIRQLSEGYWEDKNSYPEKRDVKAIWLRRAYQVGMYAGAAWTAFWAGRVEEQPPTTWWLWEGSIDDATCDDCRARIGMVYRADQLLGIPGDASTACGCNCRCWLEQVDPWLVPGAMAPMLGSEGDSLFTRGPEQEVPLKPTTRALTEAQRARLQEHVERVFPEWAQGRDYRFVGLRNDSLEEWQKWCHGSAPWGMHTYACTIGLHPEALSYLNAIFADPTILTRSERAGAFLRTLAHEMNHAIGIQGAAGYYSFYGVQVEEGLVEFLARQELESFATMLFGPEIGGNLAYNMAYGNYQFYVWRIRELSLLASGGEPARITDIAWSWKNLNTKEDRVLAIARDIATTYLPGASSAEIESVTTPIVEILTRDHGKYFWNNDADWPFTDVLGKISEAKWEKGEVWDPLDWLDYADGKYEELGWGERLL